jgi:hypothetical protein
LHELAFIDVGADRAITVVVGVTLGAAAFEDALSEIFAGCRDVADDLAAVGSNATGATFAAHAAFAAGTGVAAHAAFAAGATFAAHAAFATGTAGTGVAAHAAFAAFAAFAADAGFTAGAARAACAPAWIAVACGLATRREHQNHCAEDRAD